MENYIIINQQGNLFLTDKIMERTFTIKIIPTHNIISTIFAINWVLQNEELITSSDFAVKWIYIDSRYNAKLDFTNFNFVKRGKKRYITSDREDGDILLAKIRRVHDDEKGIESVMNFMRQLFENGLVIEPQKK